jgi:RNA polymerase subunit RPABC4/transcription elongation factor Spt4
MSYQHPYQQPPPAGGPGAYGRGLVVCPFCGGTSASQLCNWCGRDTTMPRRPCHKCGRMAPSGEPACWNCGAKFKGSTFWKILLAILLFALAITIRVIISMAR